MTEQKEKGTVYELGYHILPTVEGDAVEAVVQQIRELVTKAGGALIAEGAPQDTRLAYTMYVNNEGKNTAYTHAHFGWLKCEIESAQVGDVEAALRINKKILRSLVFKTVREETRASVRAGMLKEVKKGGTLKAASKQEEGPKEEVSEEKLDEALGEITKSE